jgi:hypothetical protein
MPGHRIAKHPLQYASAKLQPSLLFDPIGPPAPTGLHRGTPQLHFIRSPRAFSWLRFLGPSVQTIQFLDDFRSRVFGLSEERANRIETRFPRPSQDPVRSFESDSPFKTVRWIGKLMMRGSCASRRQRSCGSGI